MVKYDIYNLYKVCIVHILPNNVSYIPYINYIYYIWPSIIFSYLNWNNVHILGTPVCVQLGHFYCHGVFVNS